MKPSLQLLGFATAMLLLSTTKIVTCAQQTVLNTTNPTNTTNASIARMLADVFGSLSSSSAVTPSPPPASTGSAHSGAPLLNLTLGPDLLRYLNLTTNGLPQSAIDTLIRALNNQDPARLRDLQQSANTVTGFLSLPTSFADGTNLKNFVLRIDQLRSLRDAVSSYLSITELETITGYLLRAEQLALQSVSAFPLAALAWVLAFASLIAAVMGALGGIFYIVGSSVALAAASGAAAPAARSSADDGSTAAPSLWDNPAFADLQTQTQVFVDRVLPFALDPNAVGIINVANTLLKNTNDMLALLTPDQLGNIPSPSTISAFNPLNLFGTNPFAMFG